MAAPYTPINITQDYTLESKLNANLQAIATAFETVMNKNSAIDNAMQVDLDLNGQDLLNVGNVLALPTASDFSMDSTASGYTLADVHSNRWTTVVTSNSQEITCPLDSTESITVSNFVHLIHHRTDSTGTLTIVLEESGSQTLDPPYGGGVVVPPGGTAGVAQIGNDHFVIFGNAVSA